MEIMVKVGTDYDETSLNDFEAVAMSDGRFAILDSDNYEDIIIIGSNSINVYNNIHNFHTFADIKEYFDVDGVKGIKKIRITIEEIQ